jgi:hypothetical protein
LCKINKKIAEEETASPGNARSEGQNFHHFLKNLESFFSGVSIWTKKNAAKVSIREGGKAPCPRIFFYKASLRGGV